MDIAKVLLTVHVTSVMSQHSTNTTVAKRNVVDTTLSKEFKNLKRLLKVHYPVLLDCIKRLVNLI